MAVPFIPTPNCVHSDIVLAAADGQIHNGYWFQRAAPWTLAERQALNTALETWWVANMKALMTGTVALSSINTVNQDTQNAPSTMHIVSPAQAGTVAGGSEPWGSPVCIGLRTDFRGRNYRGRTYISPIPQSMRYGDNTVTAAHLANLIAAMQALLAVINGLGAVWVVVSKYLNKVPRGVGVQTPITAFAADTAFDSQRRRLFGRGI